MSFHFSFESASGEQRSLAPLRIAILGDFGAQTEENKSAGPLPVDCDNFDKVFEQIGVTLDMPPCKEGCPELKLQFRTLEDFHPDRLLPRLDPLAHLTDLRTKLLHPASSQAAEIGRASCRERVCLAV